MERHGLDARFAKASEALGVVDSKVLWVCFEMYRSAQNEAVTIA